MSYQLFLQVVADLAGTKKSEFIFNDHVVKIEMTSKKNRWLITSHVQTHDKYSYTLSQEVRSFSTYIPFKGLMDNFSSCMAYCHS